MVQSEHSVFLFASTSGAIRAEKLALESSFKVKLIPVPRSLSSDCGVCLRCDSADVAVLRSVLRGASVEWEEIHSL